MDDMTLRLIAETHAFDYGKDKTASDGHGVIRDKQMKLDFIKL